MKKIKYQVRSHALVYNAETETVEQKASFAEFIRDYSPDNEALAKAEAYNGVYTVEDDGTEKPAEEATFARRVAELEEALELLLAGVTE